MPGAAHGLNEWETTSAHIRSVKTRTNIARFNKEIAGFIRKKHGKD